MKVLLDTNVSIGLFGIRGGGTFRRLPDTAPGEGTRELPQAF